MEKYLHHQLYFEYEKVSDEEYGASPLTYTNILKKYLISELSNHEETKIEFVNEPQRF